MVVGTLKISLDRLKKKQSAVVSVAVSSAQCLLAKTSLCLEAAEKRPQWPRLYLLSRPRSRRRMPSL